MTTFWLFVASLLVVALVLIVPALLQTTKSNTRLNRKELNVLIAREKIADLDEEFQRGSLESQDYEDTKKELELGLFDDVNQDEDSHSAAAKPAWFTTVLILAFLPISSLLLYQYLGNPGAINVTQVQQNSALDSQENLSAMVSQLNAKLVKEPENSEDWLVLGRTHMSQRNYEEAEKAFSTLLNLQPQNPEYMLLKADAMAMRLGGSILGEPETLINSALEKDPNNLTGLWLAGMAAREKGDSNLALKHWNKLKVLLPKDSTDLGNLNQLIADVGGAPISANPQVADIASMVDKLQTKLETEPENPLGWAMLGRSYLIMNRYEDAAQALTEANKQNLNDPEIMLALADALAMANQGKMQGRPTELIEQALTIEPDNTKALWLAGMAAQERNENSQAITHWQKLLPLLADDPQSSTEVASLIKSAGGTVPQRSPTVETENNAAQSISVTVNLSDIFSETVLPEDSVFIYAKALKGPPMPLAATRMQVKDFPINIGLNDSMAMTPQMKLSSFDQVIVGARISKSGQAISSSGDLFAESGPVTLGESVELVIDKIVK